MERTERRQIECLFLLSNKNFNYNSYIHKHEIKKYYLYIRFYINTFLIACIGCKTIFFAASTFTSLYLRQKKPLLQVIICQHLNYRGQCDRKCILRNSRNTYNKRFLMILCNKPICILSLQSVNYCETQDYNDVKLVKKLS